MEKTNESNVHIKIGHKAILFIDTFEWGEQSINLIVGEKIVFQEDNQLVEDADLLENPPKHRIINQAFINELTAKYIA